MPDHAEGHGGPVEVLAARRRLSDAMHAMHYDQRIVHDGDLAHELSEAWDAYDATLRAELGALRAELDRLRDEVVWMRQRTERAEGAIDKVWRPEVTALRARLKQTEAALQKIAYVESGEVDLGLSSRPGHTAECGSCYDMHELAKGALAALPEAPPVAAGGEPWYCPHQEHSTGDCNQFCECQERIRNGTYGPAAEVSTLP